MFMIYILPMRVKAYFFIYANSSKLRNQKADVWVRSHCVTRSQDQILRAAANNRVCGNASGCGYAPTSPIYLLPIERHWQREVNGIAKVPK